jgi:hypothetical protein
VCAASANNDVAPLNYYVTAKEYLEAAKVIWVSPYKSHLHMVRFFLPIHLLLGFSLELFLKAWLRFSGLSSSQLSKPPYSHNLENLYNEAQQRGFPDEPRQSALIAHFASEHQNFGFRYLRDDLTYKPTALPYDFELFDDIDRWVDGALDVSASRKLKPGQWRAAGVKFGLDT